MFARRIIITEAIGKSPAAVNRMTGDLYLHPKFFGYNEHRQRFILLHERSHYTLDTKSELLADSNAFKHYSMEGRPLSEAVYSLHDELDMDNPAHVERVVAMLGHAQHFDRVINPNRKLKTDNQRMNAIEQKIGQLQADMETCLENGHIDHATQLAKEIIELYPAEMQQEVADAIQSTFDDFHAIYQSYNGNRSDDELEFNPDNYCAGYQGQDMESYEGMDMEQIEQLRKYAGEVSDYMGEVSNYLSYLSEAAQERRDQRAQNRADANYRRNLNVESRASIREGRGSKLADTGAAKLELAKQGISAGAEAAKAIGEGVKSITGAFGKNKVATDGEQQTGLADPNVTITTEEPKKGMPMWVWVLIAVLVIAAIAGGVMYFRSRNKAA